MAQQGTPATQGRARGRIAYLDWMRGLSALAVMLLHELNMMLAAHPVEELGKPLVMGWTVLQLVLTRWSVPVFFMVSGALLLDPGREVGWDKALRGVLRVAIILCVFCPVYTCISARGVSLGAIMRGLVRAATKGSWDHLWYLYALMGCYLLSPILSAYVRAAGERGLRMALIVLAVPTLLVVTVNRATGAGIVTVGWLTSSVFYLLLGTYAHQYLELGPHAMALGVAGLAFCVAIAGWWVLVWSWYPNWLLKPECPLIAAWALLVFLAGKRWLRDRPLPSVVAWASQLSLPIYLVHPIVLVVLYRRLMWMPYRTLPPVAFELVVLAIVVGVTIPAAAALRRLPGLRKVL